MIRQLIKLLALDFLRFFFTLFYKEEKNKIYFCAYNGKQYTCNPKAISEKIHELAPKMKIVWSFVDPNKIIEFPDYAIKVKKRSFRNYKELFTAHYWVLNSGFVIHKKRKNQYYMDTWHGDRAFKRVDVPLHRKKTLVQAYRNADVVLSGSDYGDRVIRECMDYQGEILHSGSPRNDIFFKPSHERILDLRKSLNLDSFDNLLLYAPTFRDSKERVDCLNFSLLLDQLEKRDNKKWACLVRQHYHVSTPDQNYEDQRIIDVSSYHEMQELLLIADMVISDYSSLVGDFALLGKPVFLFVSDIKEYDVERGLMFDLKSSPFFWAEKEENLFEMILNISPETGKKNSKDILDFYGNVVENGNASDQACKWIMDRL